MTLPTLDEVFQLAQQLPPQQRRQLINRLQLFLDHPLKPVSDDEVQAYLERMRSLGRDIAASIEAEGRNVDEVLAEAER